MANTSEGLYKLKSDYVPSFFTMRAHYLMLIKQAKDILERKTKHIKPEDEALKDNRENVFMLIRG